MSTVAAGAQQTGMDRVWYSRSADEVTALLGVDLATGLTKGASGRTAGPRRANALPEEKPPPGWRRFLDQYRSYMQIILVVAAVVSLAIKQWSTAGILVFLTVLNAVVGLRQEGKAESAMNALKSMMKTTARVRRDGNGFRHPGRGTGGRRRGPADSGRPGAGGRPGRDGQCAPDDESALTGESTPAGKAAATVFGDDFEPGTRRIWRSCHCPVTHGSGTVLVTGTGARTEVGRISGMLSTTKKEESPLSREMNTLTLSGSRLRLV